MAAGVSSGQAWALIIELAILDAIVVAGVLIGLMVGTRRKP